MKNYVYKLSVILVIFLLTNCLNNKKEEHKINVENGAKNHQLLVNQPNNIKTPEGMVWVKGKIFLQGAKANDDFAMSREKPAHQVTVDGFFIDITEVTNKQFKAFVDATNYVTVAERKIDWQEMKKELPPNTPKPHDSLLQPGSLIFNKNVSAVVNINNYSQWWIWKIGANWKQPLGPGSNLNGKDNFPVVHIAFEDALAYCKWANRRLPTEAEWESAAQGNATNNIFTWGNNPDELFTKANTWQGVFPVKNEPIDGFTYTAPVKSYSPNSIGIYDLTGNVWELTSDLFNENYYKQIGSKTLINPTGANTAYSRSNPYQKEHIIKGGSFLCHESYCASYRISARMGMSPDSSSDHVGFRTVATPKMLKN